jgi:hypothetical protein
MNTITFVTVLKLAGLLHIGLVCAGAAMPRAVRLREHIATLPPFIRRLFVVYLLFIGLMLVGFGTLTFFFADAIAAGEPLGRALCALMLVFWLVRLAVAAFVFDVRPYLTHWLYRIGYQATNCVFVFLVVVYTVALWRGGHL